MMGSSLRGRDEQYVASRDDKGTWRILDTYHSSLEEIGPEDDVSDDSPALTVLTEGEFLTLVKEATKIGVLVTNDAEQDTSEMESEIARLQGELASAYLEVKNAQLERDKLKEELEKRPLVNRPDSFELKSKAIDTIYKMTAGEELKQILDMDD